MSKKHIRFALLSFVIWRVVLFVILAFSLKYFPIQKDFLGGGREIYEKLPWLWAWVNFDGEHYLALAHEGYRPLTYFYFPAYPILVRLVAGYLGRTMVGFVVSGLVISNFCLVMALIGLWKLIKMDYKEEVARSVILMMLVFPTSFYLGSYYTESLFLALVVWSFYLARKDRWMLAGILGGVSSAVRVVGIVLLPALLVEYLIKKKGKLKNIRLDLMFLFLVPLGLLIYMCYLWKRVGDPLEFLHSVEIFGAQRSARFVILPQVFYRYIFKILPNLGEYWPSVFSTWLEFLVGSVLLMLSVVGFWKLRKSYWIYLVGGYTIPALAGSFSSMARYALVLFPGFILMAGYLVKTSKCVQAAVYGMLFLGLVVALSMFARGYWVA
jgi:hypothetical protein